MMLNEEGLSFVIEKIKEHLSDYPGLDQLSFTYVHSDGSLVKADIKHPSTPAFITTNPQNNNRSNGNK